MKCNAWTLALIGAGLVSLPAVTRADESTNTVLTALSATTISGYVSTSAEWAPGPNAQNQVPIPYNNKKTDGFNLDVVKLTIAKDVVPTDSWGAGYKVDLLFGPDANTLGSQSSTATAAADFGIDQAYVALHAPVGNGLDFKVGVWNTIIGYEVFDSPSNPNFTHSWGYSLEPTVHTGVLATYQLCEAVTASFGIANSFGNSINGRSTFAQESFKTYMGSLTFTAPTNMAWLGGSTLTACIINGNNASTLVGVNAVTGAPVFGENQTSYYLGATMNTPLTWLTLGMALDMVDYHNDASGKSWVAGGYIHAQATEKLSFNGRFEYMENNNTSTFFYNSLDAITIPRRATELTATVQYDLWKNVLSRVEARWDHDAGGTGVWGGTTENGTGAIAGGGSSVGTVGPTGPGEGGRRNQYLLLANIVYKF
jgi:Putative beta-barrel porin-2, OmpL-like. bbp2